MARANPQLIEALQRTADRIEGGGHYRWTHMGACTCGHLAQTVTELPAAEIHRRALQSAGDWHDQVIDHCPSSGLPMDHLIQTLLDLGLSHGELAHLERLSQPEVLKTLPLEERGLDYRSRNDVVRYLRAMATWLTALLPAALATEGSAREPEGKTSAPA